MAYQGVQEVPFDPNVQDLAPETPTLDYVIREAMRLHTLEIRCAMPAFIIAIHGNARVDVQPALQQQYRSNLKPQDIMPVQDVPVVLPSGSNYSIKVPLAINDSGLLVFCDRSLDAWVNSSGSETVSPADTRQHNLSDAVFIPGCWPFGKQTMDTTDDMVLTSGSAQVRLLQSGKLAIGSNADGGQELLSVMDAFMGLVVSLINTLSNTQATAPPGGGPVVFAPLLAQLAQLAAQAQQVQQNLDTLKGAT